MRLKHVIQSMDLKIVFDTEALTNILDRSRVEQGQRTTNKSKSSTKRTEQVQSPDKS